MWSLGNLLVVMCEGIEDEKKDLITPSYFLSLSILGLRVLRATETFMPLFLSS